MNLVCVKVKNIRPEYGNLKEWMEGENNLYIGRAGVVFVKEGDKKFRWPKKDSKWHNPFKVGKDGTREEVIEKYAEYIMEKMTDDDFKELKGKTLGCWCSPEPCHGDVLIDMVELL